MNAQKRNEVPKATPNQTQTDSTTKKKMSQEDIVLNHLRRYGSITSMQAFERYQITRLSAKIFNLREEGYRIPMRWETSQRGNRYGRYFLKEEVGA